MGGVDVEGNPFGTDTMSHTITSDDEIFNTTIDSFDINDSFSSFDDW